MRHLLSRAALGLACLAAIGLTLTGSPAPASACGGFFCQQLPMDQSAEQIVFTIDDNKVRAYIQISFQGEAEDFSWVIPAQAIPEIGVGTESLFQQLTWRTQPNFWIEWKEDSCGGWWRLAPGVAEDEDGALNGGGGGEVVVIAEKEVGPYNTVVLQSGDAQELVDWLNENGYDQPPESTPLIEHYVEQGMYFVAVKLSQDSGAGDIVPIVLDMEGTEPCVPLILTQIAAQENMPVRAWVLSESRVIPTNWMHVVINMAKIDWFSGGSNYMDVVTQAVDEAAGHGFVTEYAGPITDMQGALYAEGRFNLETILAQSSWEDVVMELLNQGFPRDSTMQGILRTHIPMPQSLVDQGVSEQEFYNCLDCYSEEVAEIPFDVEALVADLEEKVIEPLRDAQEMLDSFPYMTRVLTTVSPDEMNRDPMFAQNASLPDVSNNHTAQGEAFCGEDGQTIEKVVLTLEDGQTIEIEGDPWQNPQPEPAPEIAAALRIELIGTSGAPVLLDPAKVDQVDEQLDNRPPEEILADIANGTLNVGLPEGGQGVNGGGGGSSGGPSGCSAGHSGLPLAAGVLLMLFLAVRRRS